MAEDCNVSDAPVAENSSLNCSVLSETDRTQLKMLFSLAYRGTLMRYRVGKAGKNPSKDAFSILSFDRVCMLYIKFENISLEKSGLVCSEQELSFEDIWLLDRRHNIASRMFYIYFTSITEIYLERPPVMGFRVYCGSEVVQFQLVNDKVRQFHPQPSLFPSAANAKINGLASAWADSVYFVLHYLDNLTEEQILEKIALLRVEESITDESLSQLFPTKINPTKNGWSRLWPRLFPSRKQRDDQSSAESNTLPAIYSSSKSRDISSYVGPDSVHEQLTVMQASCRGSDVEIPGPRRLDSMFDDIRRVDTTVSVSERRDVVLENDVSSRQPKRRASVVGLARGFSRRMSNILIRTGTETAKSDFGRSDSLVGRNLNSVQLPANDNMQSGKSERSKDISECVKCANNCEILKRGSSNVGASSIAEEQNCRSAHALPSMVVPAQNPIVIERLVTQYQRSTSTAGSAMKKKNSFEVGSAHQIAIRLPTEAIVAGGQTCRPESVTQRLLESQAAQTRARAIVPRRPTSVENPAQPDIAAGTSPLRDNNAVTDRSTPKLDYLPSQDDLQCHMYHKSVHQTAISISRDDAPLSRFVEQPSSLCPVQSAALTHRMQQFNLARRRIMYSRNGSYDDSDTGAGLKHLRRCEKNMVQFNIKQVSRNAIVTNRDINNIRHCNTHEANSLFVSTSTRGRIDVVPHSDLTATIRTEPVLCRLLQYTASGSTYPRNASSAESRRANKLEQHIHLSITFTWQKLALVVPLTSLVQAELLNRTLGSSVDCSTAFKLHIAIPPDFEEHESMFVLRDQVHHERSSLRGVECAVLLFTALRGEALRWLKTVFDAKAA